MHSPPRACVQRFAITPFPAEPDLRPVRAAVSRRLDSAVARGKPQPTPVSAPKSASLMTGFVLVIAVLAALVLSACNGSPAGPTLPKVTAPQDATVPVTSGAPDPSVPDAGSTLRPPVAVPVDPAAGRTNKTMSQTQESSAMPMPGQNNDHSAPLTPAKPVKPGSPAIPAQGASAP